MQHRLFQLLISFGVLQLCSCSPKDHHEESTPHEAIEVPADNDTAAYRDQLDAIERPENPYEDVPDNEPVIHRVRAGQPDGDGWCLAKPTRGSFSVMLPGEFIDSMIKSSTTTGGTGVMHTVATTTADGVEFTVLQTELIGQRPEGSPVDGMIDRFRELGATVEQTNVTLAEQSAVRLSVAAEGVAAEFILLSTSQSEYMLAVQANPSGLRNADVAADIERFFESFRILSRKE